MIGLATLCPHDAGFICWAGACSGYSGYCGCLNSCLAFADAVDYCYCWAWPAVAVAAGNAAPYRGGSAPGLVAGSGHYPDASRASGDGCGCRLRPSICRHCFAFPAFVAVVERACVHGDYGHWPYGSVGWVDDFHVSAADYCETTCFPVGDCCPNGFDDLAAGVCDSSSRPYAAAVGCDSSFRHGEAAVVAASYPHMAAAGAGGDNGVEVVDGCNHHNSRHHNSHHHNSGAHKRSGKRKLWIAPEDRQAFFLTYPFNPLPSYGILRLKQSPYNGAGSP